MTNLDGPEWAQIDQAYEKQMVPLRAAIDTLGYLAEGIGSRNDEDKTFWKQSLAAVNCAMDQAETNRRELREMLEEMEKKQKPKK